MSKAQLDCSNYYHHQADIHHVLVVVVKYLAHGYNPTGILIQIRGGSWALPAHFAVIVAEILVVTCWQVCL